MAKSGVQDVPILARPASEDEVFDGAAKQFVAIEIHGVVADRPKILRRTQSDVILLVRITGEYRGSIGNNTHVLKGAGRNTGGHPQPNGTADRQPVRRGGQERCGDFEKHPAALDG